jgi:sirohydrochlorin cobaltochelatase
VKRALLLLAHGARDARWAAPFEDVAARIRGLAPDLAVRLSYLDFIAPDLATAGSELAREGCERVDVVPLFLGAGGHVRNDVPRLLQELAARHPQVAWRLHPAIGEAPAVIDVMARTSLALAGDAAGAPSSTRME